MKLYSMAPQDSSGKVRWLLCELEVPFEDVKLSYRSGDLKSEAYLAKHPIGQVPVLEYGDVTIYESHAIVAYLADKFISKGLAPDPSEHGLRAAYYQWIFFSTNTAEGFFTRLQNLPSMTAEYQNEWGDYIREKTLKVMSAIESQLDQKNYILGSFSAVDICLRHALDSVREEAFLKDFPKVAAYCDRLSNRDACLKSEIFKRS